MFILTRRILSRHCMSLIKTHSTLQLICIELIINIIAFSEFVHALANCTLPIDVRLKVKHTGLLRKAVRPISHLADCHRESRQGNMETTTATSTAVHMYKGV